MTEPHATPGAESHEPTRTAVPAATDAAAHGPAGHEAAAQGDHDGAPLGPVDAQAWGAGILGVGVGGLVAVLLYAASYH